MSPDENGPEEQSLSPDDVEFIDLSLNPDSLELEEMTALPYEIAAWISEQFKPGFVIIGSPNYFVTQDGVPYPDSVGIVIREGVYVKTDVAEHLKVIIHQLNGDVAKVENFLKETLNKDD